RQGAAGVRCAPRHSFNTSGDESMSVSTPMGADAGGRKADARRDSAPAGQVNKGLLKKAAAASFIGNFVEWFDYASYGYLATVIAAVFFPQTSPTNALLATF